MKNKDHEMGVLIMPFLGPTVRLEMVSNFQHAKYPHGPLNMSSVMLNPSDGRVAFELRRPVLAPVGHVFARNRVVPLSLGVPPLMSLPRGRMTDCSEEPKSSADSSLEGERQEMIGRGGEEKA